MRAVVLIQMLGMLFLAALGYVCVHREVGPIEQGLRLASREALASPDLEWAEVAVDGRDLVLAGTAPSIRDRDRALSVARATHGIHTVVDHTTVATVVPSPSSRHSGSSGSPTAGAGKSAGTGIQRNQPPPPSSATRSTPATSVPMDERTRRQQARLCQQQLDGLLANERIHFQVLSAAIRSESLPLLDDLAGALQKCPTASIEVAGHTDGEGIEELNRKLSEARAEAVRNYLIHHGIAPDRLIAVGYGATQPIADDSTQEGRLQNRRIEFKVRGIER